MALTQTQVLPAQFIQDVGKDYATQLAATTAAPLPTAQFAPSVAGQTGLQTTATGLATSGLGAYAPYLTGAATAGQAPGAAPMGLEAYGTLGTAAGLTGTGAGTGTGSIASYMSPYQTQVIDESLRQYDLSRQGGQQQIRDAAVGAGGFGGGREGAMLGQYDADTLANRTGLQAQLLAQGYGQAQQGAKQAFMNQQALKQANL